MMLAYVLWFATMGLIILIILVARDVALYSLFSTDWRRYTVHLSNEILILLLGIGAVVFVVVIEHAFRTAQSYAALLRRFCRVLAGALLVLAGLHGLYGIMALQNGDLYGVRLTAAGVELLSALALLWFQRVLGRRAAKR